MLVTTVYAPSMKQSPSSDNNRRDHIIYLKIQKLPLSFKWSRKETYFLLLKPINNEGYYIFPWKVTFCLQIVNTLSVLNSRVGLHLIQFCFQFSNWHALEIVSSTLYSQVEISTPISEPQGRSECFSRGFPFSKSYLFHSMKSVQKSFTVMIWK
jgi:hypothetical protein